MVTETDNAFLQPTTNCPSPLQYEQPTSNPAPPPQDPQSKIRKQILFPMGPFTALIYHKDISVRWPFCALLLRWRSLLPTFPAFKETEPHSQRTYTLFSSGWTHVHSRGEQEFELFPMFRVKFSSYLTHRNVDVYIRTWWPCSHYGQWTILPIQLIDPEELLLVSVVGELP